MVVTEADVVALKGSKHTGYKLQAVQEGWLSTTLGHTHTHTLTHIQVRPFTNADAACAAAQPPGNHRRDHSCGSQSPLWPLQQQ
jgi:hypothetical protein